VVRLFGFLLPPGCAPAEPSDDQPESLDDIDPAELRPTRARVAGATLRVVATGVESAAAEIAAPDPDEEHESALAAIAGKRCRCDRYHAVALLTPVRIDRAYPVILREPPAARRKELLSQLVDVISGQDELTERVVRLLRYGCLRYGELAAQGLPVGRWRHHLHVQTVNIAPETMDPTLAARIIGGLPVSQNMAPVLDVACGPFVIEDGQFDIELI
jgi:hypothetical protein